MPTNDTEQSGSRVDPWGRYVAVSDCTGRTLLYDLENDDAWLRSDAAVDPAERR